MLFFESWDMQYFLQHACLFWLSLAVPRHTSLTNQFLFTHYESCLPWQWVCLGFVQNCEAIFLNEIFFQIAKISKNITIMTSHWKFFGMVICQHKLLSTMNFRDKHLKVIVKTLLLVVLKIHHIKNIDIYLYHKHKRFSSTSHEITFIRAKLGGK